MKHAKYPEHKDEFMQTIPIARLADPREISDAILYLASERSSYMVGQSVKVDGGGTVG